MEVSNQAHPRDELTVTTVFTGFPSDVLGKVRLNGTDELGDDVSMNGSFCWASAGGALRAFQVPKHRRKVCEHQHRAQICDM
jgi:hypothetical protein